MNEEKIKINKKIKILHFFNELSILKLFLLYSILPSIIFIEIIDKLNLLIQNDILKIFINFILFVIGIIFIFISYIMVFLITRKLIKKEYIKENKSIGYLKYIPEEEIGNIQNYIQENKKDLDLQYEEELLKKQLSDF